MDANDKVLLAKSGGGELAAADALRTITQAAVEAGELAVTMLEAGVRRWNKAHDSPVTEADIAVDELLRERLRAAAPDYAWVSEESLVQVARPAQRRRWVVDPIDGTRSYIKKLPDWSISIALVEDGRPIAAALFAPVTRELFAAIAGGGATRNGTSIRARQTRSLDGARIAGPRSTLERLGRDGLAFEAVPRIHSLALRLSRVAAGDIDVALASGQSRDWDLAAADLIVHEAGGMLTTAAGKQLLYNHAETEHPPLAVAGRELHPALLAALEQISAVPAAPETGEKTKS